ncbi:MAG TPA: hypothetical protein ENI23_11570 [bacterium]|nr:hypothetical protein [bacterium]
MSKRIQFRIKGIDGDWETALSGLLNYSCLGRIEHIDVKRISDIRLVDDSECNYKEHHSWYHGKCEDCGKPDPEAQVKPAKIKPLRLDIVNSSETFNICLLGEKLNQVVNYINTK